MSSGSAESSSKSWYEHLAQLPQLQGTTEFASSDIHVVAKLREAATAAASDDDWKDSGVREMLLKALQVAEEGDCAGAVSSARGILGFLQGRQSALKRIAAAKSQNKLPWGPEEGNDEEGEQLDGSEASPPRQSGVEALATGREVLHSATGFLPEPSGRIEAGSAATASQSAGGSDRGSGGGSESDELRQNSTASAPPHISDDAPGRRPLRKSVSNPEQERQPKRSRDETGEADMKRAKSDPGSVAKAAKASHASTPLDTVLEAVAARPPTPNRQLAAPSSSSRPAGGPPSDHLGSVSSDDNFPGHHSVVDFFGPTSEIRQAKQGTSNVDSASSLYWAGKVKHKLGSSTVELTFLSALLPRDVIEHMPPTLFVTDLVERKGLECRLSLGEGQTVVKCRLDFLTNRQLHKLRTLAGLRLACVCGLQHSSVTLVPHLDAIGGLRIICFVKVESN